MGTVEGMSSDTRSAESSSDASKGHVATTSLGPKRLGLPWAVRLLGESRMIPSTKPTRMEYTPVS